MKRTLLLCAGMALAAGCAAGVARDDAGDDGARGSAGASVVTPCPDDRDFFAEELRAPLLLERCVGCHRDGGLAGTSRLVLSATEPQAGFAGAVALARETAGGVPVLLARPSGLHPEGHPGGTLTPPGTPGHARLSAFVARVAGGDCGAGRAPTCDGLIVGRRRLRRLTRAELDTTLRDLFGLPPSFSAGLAADTVVGGFDNRADVGRVSPLVASQVATVAERLAGDVTAAWPPCAKPGVTCVDALLDGVGRRVFRRPVAEEERARYRALYDATEHDEPGAGRAAVLSALLQSPHFLYRSELGGAPSGGVVALDPHERATALSYLVWGTTPDDALLDAAAAGALATAAGLQGELARLLADPRAARATDAFVSQWLELGRLDTVAKDAATYPVFDAALRVAMRDEARRFVDHVVRERHGSLADLLTSRESFVGGPLAELYGAPPGGPRPWTHEPTRAGLLTLAAVLTVHGGASGSSPIHRGKLVRERLLCQPLPPPPPSLGVTPPPVDPSRSTRERFAAHGAVEPCVGCHARMDPIGFAFEGFDGIGRARATDGGRPVDTRGELTDAGSATGPVADAAQLATRLAASPEVRACFASQWVRFGFGVDEEQELPCLTGQLRAAYRDGDGSVEGLLRALVASPNFSTRRADPGIGQTTPHQSNMSDPGDAGAPSSGGGAGGAPPVGGGQTVTVKVDSAWAGGACSTAEVFNGGGATVSWRISLDVGGALTDLWGAVDEGGAGTTRVFSGVDWNASLAPGAKASFGFCVTR